MFEVGSMPPQGYLAWHEWADVQVKGGLKQSQCGECGLWCFPQEAINHAPNKACTTQAETHQIRSSASNPLRLIQHAKTSPEV